MDVEESPNKASAVAPANITNVGEAVAGLASSSALITQPLLPSSSLDQTSGDAEITQSANLDGEADTCEPGHGQSPASGLQKNAPEEPTLSKNQQKKLKRKQHWEEQRASRKARRKEKNVEKKERKREAKAEQAEGSQKADPKLGAKQKRAVTVPITILIDCGFDELMSDKERISLAAQITRSYSENSHAPYRSHLAVSSFGGHLRTRFDTVLEGFYRAWRNVRFCEEDFVAVARDSKTWMADPRTGGRLAGAFAPGAHSKDMPATNFNNATEDASGQRPEDKQAEDRLAVDRSKEDQEKEGQDAQHLEDSAPAENVEQSTNVNGAADSVSGDGDGEIIYLTSESPHTLTRLAPHGTYIIGGLVDRNRHKGICYQRAAARGVRTAKLPIADYMQMSSRFVLATNHVVEILLAWLDCGDWGQALEKVMPKRKGARLKGSESKADESDNGDEGQDVAHDSASNGIESAAPDKEL